MRQIFRVFFNQEDKACSYLIQAAQEFPASWYLFDVTLGMHRPPTYSSIVSAIAMGSLSTIIQGQWRLLNIVL